MTATPPRDNWKKVLLKYIVSFTPLIYVSRFKSMSTQLLYCIFSSETVGAGAVCRIVRCVTRVRRVSKCQRCSGKMSQLIGELCKWAEGVCSLRCECVLYDVIFDVVGVRDVKASVSDG